MSSAGQIESTDVLSNGKTAVARVLHISDFHFLEEPGQTLLGVETEMSFAAVLERATQAPWRPDLALLTGDLVQDPCVSSYERLKRRLGALDVPCYCLPGNHDDSRLMEELLPTETIRIQPQITLNQWQIICLDSTIRDKPGGRLSDKQLRLLETALASSPNRYTLIALHHHPISSGSSWMDTMVLENADAFFAIVQKFPRARAVVFGHVHQAMDEMRGPLRLLAAPSTCFQFKPRSPDFAVDRLPPGYRWIELYSDGTLDTGVERLAEIPAGLEFTTKGY
ncbi:3',5'-cyclic adenosine monophosphate phosphodiesterase CpdA [Methylocaldum marinum]|uniref:3',5'-cyclic adenosine monophosphate phosphodiesterase CpdA n=1 Tax=Methylocaldum marinum TaxID=1432792 RepID=A0A250KPM8_9GAMM|nr:3',5'-cyclic-AMP phosphodiesterase [Methylocaldum marinum]BBA33527.1 3',5'-cyclic adenosine monophosphate phosphodiesterase CpdA [Methylocaldum marinum]